MSTHTVTCPECLKNLTVIDCERFACPDCGRIGATVDNLKQSPLEWAGLWDAMRPEPHAWIDTTEHMFNEMLNVLPPADMGKGGFLVGEANHDNANGEPVYAAFVQIGENFIARYMTQREFSAWKSIR